MTIRAESLGNFARRHRVILTLLVLTGTVILMPHLLERMFVYFPIREVEGDPSLAGLAFEDLSLVTEDGLKIHGWFVPYHGSRRTFLILHGNAGNIGHRLPLIQILHELEAHVLIIDYRGYGKSQGRPFEEGLYRDARAAAAWWLRRFSGPDQRLIVIGKSLGGPVAIDLARHIPVSGLILQSTFTSAWDMAKTLFPIGLLQPFTGVRLDSAGKIGAVTCPKLFIHGSRDEIVPIRLGRKLFDAAPEPKEFLEVPGAGHNDLIWVAGAEYSRVIRKFLDKVDSRRAR
jgi:hypothetical protein